MSSPAPCADCGAATEDRARFGTAVLCDDCLEARRAPIRERVIARQGAIDIIMAEDVPGTGRLIGPLSHGLVACSTCGSQWVGVPGSGCPWCAEVWTWLLGQTAALDADVQLDHPEQQPIWHRRGVRYVA